MAVLLRGKLCSQGNASRLRPRPAQTALPISPFSSKQTASGPFLRTLKDRYRCAAQSRRDPFPMREDV
ncbi:hypothetical protein AAFF_G00114280 [Aldrovandia affinis]|uniref:Uncharacterized protein n=1 Tax=Aldrovandia affinis TaxID=143900 RepID=A0AAD7RT27_9TELE|nr:hypothetical protein AAFF_G00114280 [Aldrovandia affinis]